MARVISEKDMITEVPVLVDISVELSIVEEAAVADELLCEVVSYKMLVILRTVPDHIFNFCTKNTIQGLQSKTDNEFGYQKLLGGQIHAKKC